MRKMFILGGIIAVSFIILISITNTKSEGGKDIAPVEKNAKSVEKFGSGWYVNGFFWIKLLSVDCGIRR